MFFLSGPTSPAKNPEFIESHAVAALGIQWAHSVTIRLIFETHAGLSSKFAVN